MKLLHSTVPLCCFVSFAYKFALFIITPASSFLNEYLKLFPNLNYINSVESIHSTHFSVRKCVRKFLLNQSSLLFNRLSYKKFKFPKNWWIILIPKKKTFLTNDVWSVSIWFNQRYPYFWTIEVISYIMKQYET